jgi:hypothetical protein
VWPSLYTDVTDAYRLNRAGRLRTDLGGVYFNAIFILALGACYAVTGQPLFLAAAFLDNFQILQQLFPLVRMDGYFILGDLAGIPDLLGLLAPIMASLLPGSAARRAAAQARSLRRGRSRQASRRPRLTAVLSALGILSAVALGAARVETSAPSALRPGVAASGTANRVQAAAWIARQVSPDVTVSCDPQMCGQLRKAGFPPARLMTLRPGDNGPLSSAVVAATPVVRDQFGVRLATVYAPLVIAGFGSGAERVEIRTVAPDGAAAFASQLASEHAFLVSAGEQLLRNKNIQVSRRARAELLAGHVDPRLFATLSALASQMPIRLVTFDAMPPGASPAVPLPGAEIGAASPTSVAAILAFLRAQQAPYLPEAAAAARGAGGQQVVTVRFGAPGLMDAGRF